MLDKLYITPRQWLLILRWALYSLLFLTVMMVQTVVLGNRTVFGIHPCRSRKRAPNPMGFIRNRGSFCTASILAVEESFLSLRQ